MGATDCSVGRQTPDEIGGVDVERPGEPYDVVHGHVATPLFEGADVRAMQVCPLGELLLGESELGATIAHASAELDEFGKV